MKQLEIISDCPLAAVERYMGVSRKAVVVKVGAPQTIERKLEVISDARKEEGVLSLAMLQKVLNPRIEGA